MWVHVENEGVCDIAGLAELEAVVTAYRHPRLKALPDIANACRSNAPPSVDDLVRLLPVSDMLHVKDYSDTGMSAYLEFEVPAGTPYFTLEVNDNRIHQGLSDTASVPASQLKA